MKVVTTSIVVLVLCALPAMPQKNGTSANRKPRPKSLTAREIARRTLPAIVTIVTENENGSVLTVGSGFQIRPDIIATNYHVIEDASRASVAFQGGTPKFEVAGTIAVDEQSDLALLEIGKVIQAKDPYDAIVVSAFSGLPMANTEAEIGDAIYVAGNPEGLEGTFSQGIVSALRGDDYIQITAPISHGSSGGPVVNRYGEVIGVASAFLKEGQNLNFAIPVAKLVRLLANRSVTKPLKPRINLGFDGLYGATFESNNGKLTQWFRFHPDGSVFATWTDPAADRARIFDQLREGSSIHKYYGRYQLSGSNIEFVLNNDEYRDSSYRGSASPTRLRLTERTIAGAEFTNDYGFVRVNR